VSQYATRAQLFAIALPAAACAGIPDADVDASIVDASATADSYLPPRYPVPLTSWGDDLTGAVCRIAAWRLLTGRRGVSLEDPGVGGLSKAHDDAIRWLRDVQANRASLLETATTPGAAATPRVLTSTRRGSLFG
jgi:phage gp36-like protein